ncbi:MAG: hypothetical protein HWN66_21915 [Candidatus Helarchaeota archaeon]|nr:hypothetical protein [Candidatus Helarchaeota archaeon]
MDELKILKKLMYYGAAVELILGPIFTFFLDFGMRMVGIQYQPLFYQMTGILITLFGVLLWYATRDIETYRIILITNIILRFSVQVPAYICLIQLPILAPILIPCVIYDLIWGIVALFLSWKANLLFLSKKNE